jgi:NTE family protein
MRRLAAFALLLLSACGGDAPVKPTEPVAPVVVAPPPVVQKPPKIGVVLGGGAARGFAHIGVIKVLEANGIKPDFIVGTSAGSVAGSLWAAGYNGFQMQQIAFDLDKSMITDWNPFGKGLIKGEGLQNFINKTVAQAPIERLKYPFACVATQFKTGEGVLFRTGNVGMAVRASSSVPGVFDPVVINGVEYVDGGLASPVPIKYAKQLGMDYIIAVDVATPPSGDPIAGKFDAVMRTFDVMGKNLRLAEYPLADVLIIPDLSKVTSADFEARHQAILEGEKAAQAQIVKIREALKKRGWKG